MTTPTLIGPAGSILPKLLSHAKNIAAKPGAKLAVLFHGPPGTGKTTIANAVAKSLANHSVEIESINGRSLTIDVVREWQAAVRYGSLFGGWKVKVINEVDLCPVMAQDLMLTYMDEIPPFTAILATSNASHESLTERFTTRFMPVEVAAPDSEEIAAMLRSHYKLPKASAAMFASGSCGNVRDAMLQAEGFAVLGLTVKRPPKIEAKVICSSRSESAKRAWDTMRAKQGVAA